MSITVAVTETSTAVSTTENVSVLDTALEDVTVSTTTTVTEVGVAPYIIEGSAGSVTESSLSFSDITTADASTTKHGLMKKLSGVVADVLHGDFSWGPVTDAQISTSDVTTNNATTSKHGWLKKLTGTASDVLHGDGNYGPVTDAQLSVSDVTTNNVSTSAHGFAPKLDGNAAHYLSGAGTYTTPAGSGGGGVGTDVIFDAKGDLPVGTAADTAARLAVGTNGQYLQADSTQTTGIKWGNAPSGTVPAGTQPGQTLRPDNTDPTVFRVRGPYELWLEDFGTGGNITYAVGSPVTSGDNCAPFINALVTKAIALNPNRGGVTMRLDRQRYYLATSPTAISGLPGFEIRGSGGGGTTRDVARGSTQIITANGVNGLQIISGAHAGVTLADFHIYGDSGTTTGNGIRINQYDGSVISCVTASDYPGGYGIGIDGGGTYVQYTKMFMVNGGNCAKTIRIFGTATNGVVIFGSWLEGINTGTVTNQQIPVAGSVGISIETGDNHRIIASGIHGFAIGIDHQATAVSTEAIANRYEWNNRNIRLGATSRNFKLDGGHADDNLLAPGQTSIGVDIVSGATDYTLEPGGFNLSKAGAVEINGHIHGRGTVIYKNMVDFQAGATGTGTYTVTNPTTDRTLNVTGDTQAQGFAVLGTLIADLKARGLIG